MNQVSSLIELAKQRASLSPDTIAYQFLTGVGSYDTLTYAELDLRARAVAATLQQYTARGHRAVLLLPPGLDYVVAFWGCLYAGVIAVPVYPPGKNRHVQRLRTIVDNAQAKFILTQQIFADTPIAAATVLTMESMDIQVASLHRNLSLHADELAFLQYTSGSTTEPKGVMISHGNIMANLAVLQHNFGKDCDVTCSWLPPYHDMGLIAGILLPLYLKARAILLPPSYFLQSPLRWLQIISQERVVLSGGPNFAYDLCSNKIQPEQIEELDLRSWLYAVNGAEPIREATLRRFIQKFAPAKFNPQAFYPCYGLAEATLMLTGREYRHQPTQEAAPLVNCGSAQREHSVRIVDPVSLQPVTDGTVGEIWASGPSIACGYWQNPQLTQAMFHAEQADAPGVRYLRTGDLGLLQDQELYVTGRSKDLIIMNGANYYPQDLELTVTESDAAFQMHGAAAFTVEVDQCEQLVVLQEIQREKVARLEVEKALRAIETAVLTEHGLEVHSIVLLKPYALPKTSSGKIQRWVCRQEYLTNSLKSIARWDRHPYAAPSTPATDDKIADDKQWVTLQQTRAWLTSWFAQHLRVDEAHISADKNLIELGVNSLTAAELGSELFNKFGRRYDILTLIEQQTIHQLAEFLVNHRQETEHSLQPSPAFTSLAQPLDPELLSVAKQIYFKVNSGTSTNNTVVEGQTYINYSGYNYLGMSGDPRVTAAVVAAIQEYGTSVSASRLVSGEKQLHRELETAISGLIDTEETAILSSGYATNLAIITHLFGPGDLVIYDALAHNSILQGAHFSGASCMAFPHNDYAALEKLLQTQRPHYKRVLIVSEGAFSMDGDIPDVPALVKLKQQFGTFLMLDEAHSIGVLGKTGCGIREYFELSPNDVDIWMGTLSKAFASCGGYVSGSAQLIENFKYTAAGFVYSAGISPANTAAALAAIQFMKQQPERVTALRDRHSLLLSLLQQEGIHTGKSAHTPIIPIMAGSTEAAMQLSAYLKHQHIYALPIFYPAVEKNLARIRLFINCLHTEEQIRHTADVIVRGYRQLSNNSVHIEKVDQ